MHRAELARWGVRALMVAAILYLAVQGGARGLELVGLAAILTGALLLPVALTWCWRHTVGLSRGQRMVATVGAAVVLLVGFAVIVRAFVG